MYEYNFSCFHVPNSFRLKYRIIIYFRCKHFLSNLIVVDYFSVNKLFKYRLILVVVSLTQFNNLFSYNITIPTIIIIKKVVEGCEIRNHVQ